MLETRQTIMDNIRAHIECHGGIYAEWRIGLCTGQACEALDIPAAAEESLLVVRTRAPDDAVAIMAYFVYIRDVVRDKKELPFENCDAVYVYRAKPEEEGSA